MTTITEDQHGFVNWAAGDLDDLGDWSEERANIVNTDDHIASWAEEIVEDLACAIDTSTLDAETLTALITSERDLIVGSDTEALSQVLWTYVMEVVQSHDLSDGCGVSLVTLNHPELGWAVVDHASRDSGVSDAVHHATSNGRDAQRVFAERVAELAEAEETIPADPYPY